MVSNGLKIKLNISRNRKVRQVFRSLYEKRKKDYMAARWDQSSRNTFNF